MYNVHIFKTFCFSQLLDVSIKNINNASASSNTQPMDPQNLDDVQTNQDLTPARITKLKTTSSPMTEEICNFDLIFGTFTAICWTEMM